jgi:MFS family permease
MHLKPLIMLRVFLPFGLGYFLSYLYRTVNAIIAPNLIQDIGLDPASLGLLTASYFLSFAAFQLPLGVLLDRYGPRRVEAVLMLLAATGAFIFARAESLTGLMMGRALIGFGVSACLMAAFKAFTIWLPPERLPLANGIQMVSGGIGALAATTPIELALTLTDWRGVFLILSGLTVATAICLFLVVPEKENAQTGENFRKQLVGIQTVFTSRIFWSIAPWTFTAQAAFLAVIGLWSGPWLRDVAGYDRMSVAHCLMGISLAMTAGFLIFGALTEPLARRGIRPMTLAAWGMLLFIIVQGILIMHIASFTFPLFLLFGFFGASCILPYAVFSQSFPRQLAGRANTGLNVLAFIAAFAAQWAIGVIIGLWPQTDTGGYPPAGYQAGFGLILTFQLIAAGWYFFQVVIKKPDYRCKRLTNK